MREVHAYMQTHSCAVNRSDLCMYVCAQALKQQLLQERSRLSKAEERASALEQTKSQLLVLKANHTATITCMCMFLFVYIPVYCRFACMHEVNAYIYIYVCVCVCKRVSVLLV